MLQFVPTGEEVAEVVFGEPADRSIFYAAVATDDLADIRQVEGDEGPVAALISHDNLESVRICLADIASHIRRSTGDFGQARVYGEPAVLISIYFAAGELRKERRSAAPTN
jgi:hypothetical protein